MLLKVEGVWCKTRTEFDKFARSEQHDLAISFSDIQARLVKSDPYSQEPSETIISLYIMRLINKVMAERKLTEETKIVYMFKNLDRETVCNFKEFMDSFQDSTLEFNLTIINRTDYPKKGVLSKFTNVKFVEND